MKTWTKMTEYKYIIAQIKIYMIIQNLSIVYRSEFCRAAVLSENDGST